MKTTKKSGASDAGRALSKLGAAKGGKARAAQMSPEERSDVARAAAAARWLAQDADDAGDDAARIPRATHAGTLKIGGIPCAVLDNGQRVLTEEGFFRAIGRSGNPYVRGGREHFDLPPFLAAENLKPFISDELRSTSRPIVFRPRGGGGNQGKAWGYPAELLPQVCTVFLDARDARTSDGKPVLLPSQDHIAKACDILIRGLATVGIVALVDEATGYQRDRDRDALHKLLGLYIAKELLPWAQRFPDEFYKEMFRLRGWSMRALAPGETGFDARKGPRFAGKLTNQLVYEKLPPNVLNELRTKNPVVETTGRRRYRHHQLLTVDVGHEHLRDHILQVVAVMRGSQTWSQFEASFERAFPAAGPQPGAQQLDAPAQPNATQATLPIPGIVSDPTNDPAT